MIPNSAALEEYLLPLMPYLNDAAVSDIIINRPQHILLESNHGLVDYTVPDLDWRHLTGLAGLMARHADQNLNEEQPFLAGILPSGHRIQIVQAPATSNSRIIIVIRKQVIKDVSLDDLAALGMFDHVKPVFINHKAEDDDRDADDDMLLHLFNTGQFIDFLKVAILFKKNIIISGATSTGKTTFLNACLKEIPTHEHIVTLEDTAEVKPPHTATHTPLFAPKNSAITMNNLVEITLRLNPERIVMGEMRGVEAVAYINATATGHDGGITTIHARSPQVVFMRLVHMFKLSGSTLTRADILADLHMVVDIIVQLKRVLVDGKLVRQVSGIYYAKAR